MIAVTDEVCTEQGGGYTFRYIQSSCLLASTIVCSTGLMLSLLDLNDIEKFKT